MKILCFDTSGNIATCALWQDGAVTASAGGDAKLRHSSVMLPLAEGILKDAGMTAADVDVFAAVVGPGSFTGIRVAVAAAKGFGWSLGKPCAGISSLEAAAWAASDASGKILAVIKARPREYFYGIFESDGNVPARLCPDGCGSPAEILEQLGSGAFLAGDGAEDFLREPEAGGAQLTPTGRVQSAAAAARCAGHHKNFSEAKDITPAYLKLSQAERNLKK